MRAEEGHIRQPLPSREEIARLPPDGGAEFNRLIFSQSPYLLQHARNPVDWYPWGDEAFEKANREGKPVFLSIGYTTCHWCHVMEHQSFEDEEVAAIVNRHFVPVKVDREERPDIDEVYMAVTQAMTGSGGWPMTVFLTPDRDPFFAGTYFPRESVGGRPGFKFLLGRLHELWTREQEKVVKTAENISRQLGDMMAHTPGDDLSRDIFDIAFGAFERAYDDEHAGFSRAPKFPVPPNLMFLMRYHHRTGNRRAMEMVEQTLVAMRRGGIYDQIGFGIHRYSTDRYWLLPHFEKMLYDQALVAMVYVEAHQITGQPAYERSAREILTYVLRDMTSEEGGFYSAEDADSEGEEGRFYVWPLQELIEVLGEADGTFFAEIHQCSEEGNFVEEKARTKSGANIPHLDRDLTDEELARIEPLREKLFLHREKRVRPEKDDKILTDWNGLMIAALAQAGQAFGDPAYTEAARRAAEFVLGALVDGDGRLLKRYRNGEAGLTAHLEDYAFFIWGLLDLYEATFETRYLGEAIRLQGIVDEYFWNEEGGGYFMTADDAEELIVRAMKLYGGALPGGNSVAVTNLARLHRMTGNDHYATRNETLLRAFSTKVAKNPMYFPSLLCGLDSHLGPSHEVVVSAETRDAAGLEDMLAALRKPFSPHQVVMLRTEENAGDLAALAPYTRSQRSIDGKPTAFVCQDFTCQLPTTDADEMRESLKYPAPQ